MYISMKVMSLSQMWTSNICSLIPILNSFVCCFFFGRTKKMCHKNSTIEWNICLFLAHSEEKLSNYVLPNSWTKRVRTTIKLVIRTICLSNIVAHSGKDNIYIVRYLNANTYSAPLCECGYTPSSPNARIQTLR